MSARLAVIRDGTLARAGQFMIDADFWFTGER
jgi:hypothetical protein